MLDMNKIRGQLSNGKAIRIKKEYFENGKKFMLFAQFWGYNSKIRLEIEDCDILLDDAYGHGESDVPLRRRELKDFDTAQEVVTYIFRTSTLTEADFPNKFKIKKQEEKRC
ncbi:hypothetical protein HYU19_02940 [Candidatus Woesearchaeota archaeon]|nr:hypothetical protein [Candidatus Woesearchaeota archaeon]